MESLMKIAVLGKHVEDLLPVLGRFPQFEIVPADDKPELIIAHGGDGTLLETERNHPGIVKFPIRDSRSAPLCTRHETIEQIERLAAGNLGTLRLPKLVGESGGRTVKGINDVFVHNQRRGGAIRYRVLIDGATYASEVVGDAVGVSTVHGSTAYYRNITNSVFRVGIGLAFSNCTEVINHLVLPETAVVVVCLLRGPAILLADNSGDDCIVETGGEIEIRQTAEYADVLGLDLFMCHECRKLRHRNRNYDA
jgi:NAD+ kinase